MSYNSTNTGAEIQAKLDKIVNATATTDGLMSADDKTKLDGLSTGIFWATYGTTTFAEILEAYNAGKLIAVKYGIAVYYLYNLQTNTQSCGFVHSSVWTCDMLYCQGSTWTTYTRADAGYNEVTTLANLPVTRHIILATLSAATTISATIDATYVSDGFEIYIICTPTASFTQPIPNSGDYVSMSGSSIKVTSGVPFEISMLFVDSKWRITVKTQG